MIYKQYIQQTTKDHNASTSKNQPSQLLMTNDNSTWVIFNTTIKT